MTSIDKTIHRHAKALTLAFAAIVVTATALAFAGPSCSATATGKKKSKPVAKEEPITGDPATVDVDQWTDDQIKDFLKKRYITPSEDTPREELIKLVKQHL
ncbi:hypothetical protein TRVA0_075S00276 [Trichomonascus vanleenenianus]|uniref:Ish1 domain-containing protein n=1 Tax=Trichomonascus vanleenenianus TaxID=2268995 RepID=UPI003ECB0277